MKKEKLVSVVIPCRNSSETISACLESIKNQSYNNIEIIVVDNNSTDNTKKIAKNFTNTVFNKGPERSAQRNFGAKKAKGKYLFFIDSDMVLDCSVIEKSVNLMKTNDSALGVIVPEKSFGDGFWSKCKIFERSLYLNVDWMEAPRFFENYFFKKCGGYDSQNTGTEDFDLPQRMQRQYDHQIFFRINSFINHNEGRISLLNVLKKKFYYAQCLKKYISSNKKEFSKQANILNRYGLFFKNIDRMAKEPHIWIGAFILKSLEFLAGAIGYAFGNIKYFLGLR